MTTALLTRRFLTEAARNPVTTTMLIVVPVVFVAVAAKSIADAAELLGGRGGAKVETATAGWAAAFISAIAMYFQTRSARATDRRLVLAGLPPARLVTARLTTGLVLALVASAAALVTLAARSGIGDPTRTTAGTLMFALTYLAIGALIGAVFGRVGGVFTAFLVPFLDLGIEQSPMLNPEVSGLGHALPGYGATRILYDAAFTPAFDETGPLLVALAWLTALALASGLLFRRSTVRQTVTGRGHPTAQTTDSGPARSAGRP